MRILQCFAYSKLVITHDAIMTLASRGEQLIGNFWLGFRSDQIGSAGHIELMGLYMDSDWLPY